MEFVYGILALVLLVAGIFIYFVPSYVAWYKEKKNLTAIFVLNLFLGWTFVGWVIALIWSVCKDN